MDNTKLNEIKNNIAMLPVLQQRYKSIMDRIDEAQDKVESLLKKYEEECLDVEHLQKESFSVTVLKFIGKYEDKIDKESKEMLVAKIEYDKAVEHVNELNREKNDLESRISLLENERQTYESEIKNREQYILNQMNSDISYQYKDCLTKIEHLNRQMIEMDEALRAARNVGDTAKRAITHLDSAESWATYDIWFRGGILSHMAKYDHIDNAEEEFNRLSIQLKDLQKELLDIEIVDTPEITWIDSTTRAIDFWFDNIFTDMNVRSQIQKDSEQIRDLYKKLENIISVIERKRGEAEIALKEIENRKNELIITFNF
ncbi:hypothetical protein EDD66_10663 [Mobilisporobacter senegalensis]|uniref:Uncharacterized protein n=1 Tax=Mobilisporobacter senegalensis TaxID=1329262 RepID=A0A3N1XMG1_9FIRM|nr:hypothetical protein [Mobilisporobacter senegalensis]ROR27368.1 hypothetical protein EDD66_10663 [Mobilisporobacter senegalensis]